MADCRKASSEAYGDGRVTAQRTMIAETARELPGAFTVDELAASVRAKDAGVGAATVYRAVSAMEATGWLERVGERSGSVLYARCPAGDGHHHHVVCTGCGRVEPAECPLGDVVGSQGTGGFVITSHHVTLYGLCPACLAGSRT